MKRSIVIIVFCLAYCGMVSGNLYAQSPIVSAASSPSSTKNYPIYPHPAYLGFSIAMHSGYGLSFHYRLMDEFRIKTVFFAYFRDSDNKEESIYNGGVEGQYDLFRDGIKDIAYRFYTMGGYRYYQSRIFNSQFFSSNNSDVTEEYQNNVYGGIGTEVLVFDRVAFGIDFSLNYKNLREFDFFQDSFNPTRVKPERVFSIGVGISGGIMF